MNNIVKSGKLTYLYSFLSAVVFSAVLFIFANHLNITGSVVPFILISVYDIVNVLIVKSSSPRSCFGPFVTSSLTVFLFYKVISVDSAINMYKSDGFLTDGEFSHAYALDILMVLLVISTFVFNVFLRYLISRKKLKSVSKVSIKRFAVCLAVLVCVGLTSLFSWNAAIPYRDAYIEHVSTFSAEKWDTFPQSRINMFNSLISDYQLKGMSKNELEDLLGIPDLESADGVIYNLGDDENGHNQLFIAYVNNTVSGFELKTEMFMADVVEKVQN